MKKFNGPDRCLLVQFVRNRLFCVFHVFYSSNNKKTILKNNIDLSNPQNFKSTKKTITIDGQKMKLESAVIRATETTSFRCSSVLLSELNYHHLSWSRAVRKTYEHEQAWIYYCYGNKLDFDYQIIICRYVWFEFYTNIVDQQKKIRSSTIELLKKLVLLAVQNAVYKIKHDLDFYDSKKLANLTKKSVSSWSENYNNHWHQLLNICYKLDSEALINVDKQKRNNQ